MGRLKQVRRCPRCDGKNLLRQDSFGNGVVLYVCTDCDHEFTVRGIRLRGRSSAVGEDDFYYRETDDDDRTSQI